MNTILISVCRHSVAAGVVPKQIVYMLIEAADVFSHVAAFMTTTTMVAALITTLYNGCVKNYNGRANNYDGRGNNYNEFTDTL